MTDFTLKPHGVTGRMIMLFCVLGIGIFPASLSAVRADDRAPKTETANRGDDDGVEALQRLSDAFARISEATKPSVVHIRALSLSNAVNRDLQRMLGDESLRPIPTTGTGSGIIIDAEGHIVTNNHVVADSRKVYVTLADGRKFTAKVVGTDAKTDIAVLKISADRLIPAKLGDSDALRAGQIVLAIGSPFRLGHSVSHGIISAIGRSDDSIDVDIAYKNWIQTDAPINPGNSGGPLINTRGEVVGINVAIATESGGHQGVGFAIPSNTVLRISGYLKNGEKVVRGYLGVIIKPVDDRVADAYGLGEVQGAFIAGVGGDSPAAKAGIKAEDIVLAVEGKAVRSQADLQELIATYRPGSRVDMTVWRRGSKNDLNVLVGAQPDGFSTRGSLRTLKDSPHVRNDKGGEANEEEADHSTGRFGDLGFEAENVTPLVSKKYKLDTELSNGVLITQVDPTSEAWESGLRTRQVIIRANDKTINDVNDLQDALTKQAVAKGVRLKCLTDGDDDYVVFRVR